MRYVADIQGVEVCVLGSGDNEVAFALAGLGGRVTSVDISARRLAVVADRARTLNFSVRFVQADVTDLSVLADDSFGLVYTGGHVSVWVANIQQYYEEAGRILAPGGLFVAHEYHPMRRMWEDADSYEPRYRYLDRGPHRSSSTFEYHWTVADHVQAAIDGGCRIVEVVTTRIRRANRGRTVAGENARAFVDRRAEGRERRIEGYAGGTRRDYLAYFLI